MRRHRRRVAGARARRHGSPPRSPWLLATVLLAGCHLVLDPARRVGDDAGPADAGTPHDAGPPDASGSDAGPDAGGRPCGSPGPDPVCGPVGFATCGDDMRCRPCWGEQARRDLYYESGGARSPVGVEPALALVRDEGGDPQALLAWAVDPSNPDDATDDIVVPVVSAIPLLDVTAGPVDQHLTPTAAPFGELQDTRGVALRAATPGGTASEATLVVSGADAGGADILATGRLAVVGALPVMSDAGPIATAYELLSPVAVTGRSVGASVDPLLKVWAELSPSDGVLLESQPVASSTNIVAMTDGLGSGDIALRGTAGQLVLVQDGTAGDVYLWDATSGNAPVMRTTATGRADLAGGQDGEYVIAYPSENQVELVRIRCADAASCGSVVDGMLTYEDVVGSVAVALIDGGVVVAAVVDEAFEHVLTVRVVDEGFVPVESVYGLDWIDDAAPSPLFGLDVGALSTEGETWVVVASLRHHTGTMLDEYQHVVHSLKLEHSCPTVP